MSRMAIPTMDVVRFREGDVIVASGFEHKLATLFNWGTGSVGDAGIQYTNGHDFTHSLNYLKESNDCGELDRGVLFVNGDNERVSLGDLVDSKDANGAYSNFNGTYETINNGKLWTWYNKQ